MALTIWILWQVLQTKMCKCFINNAYFNIKVCCPALVFSTQSPFQQGTTSQFMFVPLGTQTAPTAVPTFGPPITAPPSPIKLPTNEVDKCGMSNATHSRVVGGNNAQLGAYPWLGAIGYRVTGGIKYLCGGTLITQKHVL